ncbi:MAG: acetyl-CoA carboxylase carboxyltransferase subunit alpha [Kiritimatiellae bacterium]|nr:acetyl-CoA carboxylase carboxyltransferase subunit alpha [Kiritimatiellia bacterium]
MNLDFEKNMPEIEAKIAELTKQKTTDPNAKVEDQLTDLQKQLESLKKEVYSSLTPWQTVQVARHPNRPLLRDYIAGICGEFIELHGDRYFGDDQGIIGGFATIEDRHVMIIGHQKGKTLEENVKTNFGMATPDGYRKALRLMKLAEKFKIPIVSFIDTPGAYPGADAEARGQAEAIARNLTEMSQIEVPIIVIVTGEGGSGGALGIGVGDVILMLSNSVYSVISPEGCASILWRDGSKAPEAAEALKVTADSLSKLGIIDEIIPEPLGGAHRDYEGTLRVVKQALLKHLNILRRVSERKLVERRFEKYCRIGRFKRR